VRLHKELVRPGAETHIKSTKYFLLYKDLAASEKCQTFGINFSKQESKKTSYLIYQIFIRKHIMLIEISIFLLITFQNVS